MTIIEMIIEFFLIMIVIQIVSNIMIWQQGRKAVKTLQVMENARKCGFDIDALMEIIEEKKNIKFLDDKEGE